MFTGDGLQGHAELANVEFHENDIVFGGTFNAMFEKNALRGLQFGKANDTVGICRLSLDRYTESIRVHVENATVAMETGGHAVPCGGRGGEARNWDNQLVEQGDLLWG